MEFRIKESELMAAVDEVISRSAARNYSEDGSALYDGLRIISRDRNIMEKLVTEASAIMKGMCNRFLDHEISGNTEDEIVLVFALSERRGRGKADIIIPLVRNSLAELVVARYFTEKEQPELAAKHDNQAAADMQTLSHQLYMKLEPKYPNHKS